VVDVDPQWAHRHEFDGCSISEKCGISLNYVGFHPCAVAAAIDRIFRLKAAIPRLVEVTEAAMRAKYRVFCRLCGFYRPIRENSTTLLSPAWRGALARGRGIESLRAWQLTASGCPLERQVSALEPTGLHLPSLLTDLSGRGGTRPGRTAGGAGVFWGFC
jgi:hypothetical protein